VPRVLWPEQQGERVQQEPWLAVRRDAAARRARQAVRERQARRGGQVPVHRDVRHRQAAQQDAQVALRRAG